MRGFIAAIAAVLVTYVVANNPVAAEDIAITVSPNVINIESEAEVVTVHTEIAYSMVVASSVFLNSVEIDHWKADNRGNFVAKFLAEEVKALKEVEDAGADGKDVTLTLEGLTKSGDSFSGADDVKVISVKAKKK